MTLVRPISDLHLEFSNGELSLPELDTDKDTVLVLAGDIGIAKQAWTYKPFVTEMSERFLHIIMILGNHEHYHGKLLTSHNKMRVELSELMNVDILEKDCLIINDVAFICATLWTDMDNGNPLVMEGARNGMNDYNLIRHGPIREPWKYKLKPIDTMEDHQNAKHYIFKEIKKQKAAGKKVVVVGHHGPSYKSVHEQYVGLELNGAYVSELSEEILDLDDAQPEIWLHGHMHNNFDYMIGNTRVICNPRGYFEHELNPEFDDTLVIDV